MWLEFFQYYQTCKIKPTDTESNSSICKYGELQDEFYHNTSWWTNGILSVCIATVGIFLNATSLYIVQGKNIKETIFNTLAILIAIIDILLLLNVINTSIVLHLSKQYLSSCVSHSVSIIVNFWEKCRQHFFCTTPFRTTV